MAITSSARVMSHAKLIQKMQEASNILARGAARDRYYSLHLPTGWVVQMWPEGGGRLPDLHIAGQRLSALWMDELANTSWEDATRDPNATVRIRTYKPNSPLRPLL